MARFESLVDVYRDAVRTFPDNPVFGTKSAGQWEWITYLAWSKATDAFRSGLAALGVSKGDRVAIIANNRVEWATAAYACFGLGAAFVPMYEAQSPKDWDFIVRDCEAKVLIVASDAICEKARAFLGAVPSLAFLVSMDPATKTDDRVRSFAALATPGSSGPKTSLGQPRGADIACLIYTSGTTGNPKGVILSHGNIASNLCAVHDVMPISSADRSLSFLPWAHSFGQTAELHGLISMGASIAIAESTEKIIDNLAETQPTLLFSVPRIFNKIYAGVQKQIASKPPVIQKMVASALATRRKQRNGEEVGLREGVVLALTDKLVFSKVRGRFGGRLRYAFSGGAAIAQEVAEFIDSLGIMVYEGYGLTETSPIATTNWPNSRKIGSVGRPLPGVKVTVSDEGELIVHGPNVMVGYHNRREENDAVFTADRGFRTGDLGRIDDDGFVYITGRLKEQYKLENGKYVVPTPLEEQLKLSAFVTNVMIHGDNRPYNVALVVANMESVRAWAKENGVGESDAAAMLGNAKVRTLFKKELEQYGAKFKGFEEVRDFALVEEDFTCENGLLTPSLKVKRRNVLERYGALLEALYGTSKSRTTEASTAVASAG